MPRPYYERDGITIYHGDCREIVPHFIEYPGAVIADPPYGVAAVVRGKTFGTSNAAQTNEYIPVHGDDTPFDPAPLLTYMDIPLIIWGANHFSRSLPEESRWLVWDKRDGLAPNPLADCELAWTNLGGPARLFHHRWMGMVRDSENSRRWHPTQKPVALMLWCLGMCKADGYVLDPYMGCAPILVAAKQLNRRAVGIETEERYCEIAAKRLSQQVLAL